MRFLFAVCCCAATLACSEERSNPAQIELDREPMQLPAAFVGSRQQQSLQVRNQGDEPLTVTSVTLSLPDGGTLPDGGAFTQAQFSETLPGTIAPLGTAFIRFEFAPKDPGEHAAKLVIESDAPNRPKLETTVTGCGATLDGGC